MPRLPRNMVRRKDRPGYYYRWMAGGRARWLSLGTDYEEACRKLRRMRNQEIYSNATVREVAQRWLSGYVATARNAKGRKLTERRVQLYLVPELGHYRIGRLTSEHVRAYRLKLERKVAVQTVSHLLSDLRCCLRWCEDTGLIERSPFPRRVMPRVQERPPDRIADPDALRQLPEPYGFVCRLFLGTGLRWAEGCRAQAKDVERGFLVVSQTKSGRVRRVPLESDLLNEIRHHVGRLVPFAECSPGSFAQRVRKLTGLEGFHVHQMRHEFASSWLEKGRSLAALQQVLGHASIVTTQRYARLSDDAVMAELKVGRL